MALARLALNMGKVFSIVFLWIILLWSLKQFLPDPKRFRLPQKDEKRWKLKTDHGTIGWSQRQGQRKRPLIMITSMIKGFGWVACRAEEKEGNLGSWLRKTKVILISSIINNFIVNLIIIRLNPTLSNRMFYYIDQHRLLACLQAKVVMMTVLCKLGPVQSGPSVRPEKQTIGPQGQLSVAQ